MRYVTASLIAFILTCGLCRAGFAQPTPAAAQPGASDAEATSPSDDTGQQSPAANASQPVADGGAAGAAAAPATHITIRFKVFDTNNPAKRLDPAAMAQNFVRDPVTKAAVFQDAVAVKRQPAAPNLDELIVQKGWLIEQLVIPVVDPLEVYNPAFVTKVVTNADMTLYPGASKSTDDFAFQAYMAQMTAYRSLLEQLLAETPPTSQSHVRDVLRSAFDKQLRNMSDLNARLVANALIQPTEKQLASARQLRDEVLRLYGYKVPAAKVNRPVQCKSCYRVRCRRCRR